MQRTRSKTELVASAGNGRKYGRQHPEVLKMILTERLERGQMEASQALLGWSKNNGWKEAEKQKELQRKLTVLCR